MNNLRHISEEYLELRRALGYKLVGEGGLLASFVAFAESAGVDTVTTPDAVAWTKLATTGSPAYLARRMRVVRSFARYLSSFDSRAQIPPSNLFPNRKYRPTPYIYSDAEVIALMTAAAELSPPLRSATSKTLIGLLAATGMRISEAMNLDDDDIDFHGGLLVVRDGKFGKSREVLLHVGTVEALTAYAGERDQLSRRRPNPSFFVSTRGSRLVHPTVYWTFRQLLRSAGFEQRSSSRQPRVHDLRHTFAVKTLLGWYRDGNDVAALMPLLSTYLGHVDPKATYWYLSAVPELLGLAALRLESASKEQS